MRNSEDRPNIIIMYADDLGYGDIGCYGATAIPTPHIDALAAVGRRFTAGYATAATCTPSRYSLLTGSYPWRNRSAHILRGDAPLIIPPAPRLQPKTPAPGAANPAQNPAPRPVIEPIPIGPVPSPLGISITP